MIAQLWVNDEAVAANRQARVAAIARVAARHTTGAVASRIHAPITARVTLLGPDHSAITADRRAGRVGAIVA
jgi:hypothetical protein